MALPKELNYIKEHPSIFTFSCHWKEEQYLGIKILKLKM